jgi:hypothetical protein
MIFKFIMQMMFCWLAIFTLFLISSNKTMKLTAQPFDEDIFYDNTYYLKQAEMKKLQEKMKQQKVKNAISPNIRDPNLKEYIFQRRSEYDNLMNLNILSQGTCNKTFRLEDLFGIKNNTNIPSNIKNLQFYLHEKNFLYSDEDSNLVIYSTCNDILKNVQKCLPKILFVSRLDFSFYEFKLTGDKLPLLTGFSLDFNNQIDNYFFYIFGGVDKNGLHNQDLYKIDLDFVFGYGKIRKVNIKQTNGNITPAAISEASLNILPFATSQSLNPMSTKNNDYILILYGGINDIDLTSNFFYFSSQLHQWNQINIKYEENDKLLLQKRKGHSAIILNDEENYLNNELDKHINRGIIKTWKMLVFGGKTELGYQNDIQIIQINYMMLDDTFYFKKINLDRTIDGEAPEPREGHKAIFKKGYMYIFGGCNYEINKCYNKKIVHRLSLKNLKWEKIQLGDDTKFDDKNLNFMNLFTNNDDSLKKNFTEPTLFIGSCEDTNCMIKLNIMIENIDCSCNPNNSALYSKKLKKDNFKFSDYYFSCDSLDKAEERIYNLLKRPEHEKKIKTNNITITEIMKKANDTQINNSVLSKNNTFKSNTTLTKNATLQNSNIKINLEPLKMNLTKFENHSQTENNTITPFHHSQNFNKSIHSLKNKTTNSINHTKINSTHHQNNHTHKLKHHKKHKNQTTQIVHNKTEQNKLRSNLLNDSQQFRFKNKEVIGQLNSEKLVNEDHFSQLLNQTLNYTESISKHISNFQEEIQNENKKSENKLNNFMKIILSNLEKNNLNTLEKLTNLEKFRHDQKEINKEIKDLQAIKCINGYLYNKTHCECIPGYHGKTCELEMQCKDNCSNNGKCKFGKCFCNPGFVGEKCEIIQTCGLKDCSNQGTCKNGKCFCDVGFAGKDCEIVQKCENDCSNKGLCMHGKCLCEPGYAGKDCSKANVTLSINNCTNVNHCSGNGVCKMDKCFCYPGFSGKDCSVRRAFSCAPFKHNFIPEDFSNKKEWKPCFGNGICKYGMCFCFPGFEVRIKN